MTQNFSARCERYVLHDGDFRKLIEGEVITIETSPHRCRIELALADVGFEEMMSWIREARRRLRGQYDEP